MTTIGNKSSQQLASIIERIERVEADIEIEAIKDTYRNALGEFVSTPLGAAAVERVEAA